MFPTRRLRILIAFLALALLSAVIILYKLPVPKPQIASAAGQTAPDFTLLDQSAQPFHLADQRGHKVLLIFYRGYW